MLSLLFGYFIVFACSVNSFGICWTHQVKGPSGERIHEYHDRTSEKSEFVAHHEGIYRFCFSNKSPYHETIDFDVHAGHFTYQEEHAKDGELILSLFHLLLYMFLKRKRNGSLGDLYAEHFKPLYAHIGKLEEALYNIQFEQHWLEAQTDRQSLVNYGMSKRAIHKAFFESAALVGASVLQVFLLRRLFERKLGMSRV
ncbi:hypothetical protein Leryth_005099 [Lithospermum erythrorhizon]|nr:hypothetical protein Leryth_005099 [Lithospermum erythrorhizon]